MTVKFSQNKIVNILLNFLWIGAILACIKSIFTDSAYDNAYSMAMSYRHLNGDLMFQTMREPHQTSIYLTDILMYIYKLVVPDLSGVLIYLQISGTILFGLISIPLYKAIRLVSSSETAQLACIFFNVFRAKQSPFPEYSNLLIGFSVLGFSLLILFLNDEGKERYLVGLGVSTCLAILAYPTALLIFPVVIVLLCFYSKSKKKNVLIYSGICAVSGGLYVLYFVSKMGLNTFVQNLGNILKSDSHSTSDSTYYDLSVFNYFRDAAVCVLWVAITVAVSLAVVFAIRKLLKIKADFGITFAMLLTISEVVMLVIQQFAGFIWITKYYVVVLVLITASIFFVKKLNEEEKKVWISGLSISLATFLAPLLLSNLEFSTIWAYLILGACVSFVSLEHMNKNAIISGIVICGLVVIHRGLVVYGYTNANREFMIYQVTNIVREGPSKGLVCDTDTACRFRDEIEDYELFINENDTFFLVGEYLIDSTEFMLPKGKIANHSTIDTPFYNEKVEEYFEDYPEKRPTVVAVYCPYGYEVVPENSYIMGWIRDNYEYVDAGRYWKFYRR